jgi:hypothetical protein
LDPRETSKGDWVMMTEGQARELARELIAAVNKAVEANCLEAFPPDAWLDARLREHGCPDDQLPMWRERVRSMPLRALSTGDFFNGIAWREPEPRKLRRAV